MITAFADSGLVCRQPLASEPSFPAYSDEYQRELVEALKLLADQSRLKILLDLAREGELHVSALCERLGQAQPAVSHHLALLKYAGLVEMRRAGKFNYYSLCRSRFHGIISKLFQALDTSTDEPPICIDDWTLVEHE
jgi:ArsR family transcriptional regulator